MKLEGKKIIVVGGAGFIGSNLTKIFVEAGYQITVIDNFSQGKRENLSSILNKSNLKVAKADILDLSAMMKLTENADIIFHLAVQGLRKSLKDPIYVHEVNTTGTLNLLWAAHTNKVKRFVYCSSSEVYGTATRVPMDESHPKKPTTVYGASKLVGEVYTECFYNNFGLETVIIRPFNTYGYNSQTSGPYGEVIPRFVVQVKSGISPIIYGDGSQTRDFTFVEDTVRGIILAGTEDKLVGQVVNIARGQEASIKHLAEVIIRLLGSNLEIEYQPGRPHDVLRHFADISKAKKLLDFNPTIDIEDGIKRYIRYLEDKNTDFTKLLSEIPKRNW